MIEGSEKRNRQLAFELQNSHVCEKRSNYLLLAYLVMYRLSRSKIFHFFFVNSLTRVGLTNTNILDLSILDLYLYLLN